jgi:trimethylamine-N-oxide reductase cytochrome c-type subunit TorC
MTLRTAFRWLLTPTLLVGVVAGVILWGGFNTVMEATNTLEFCVSCHEMRDNPFKEYQASVHYRNASGVRAICSDCHVPKDWTHKIVRKAQATNEIIAKLAGTVDTPEKFETRRLDLARHEWARMKASDSRECRNCHSFEAMDHGKQSQKAAGMMSKAAEGGWTCIDCHKGIAHRLPDLMGRAKTMRADLTRAVAAETLAKGDMVTAVGAAPFALTADAAESAGEIAPGAVARIVEVAGERLRLEVSGWRREGSDEKLYAARGKRILQADLQEAAADKVETLRSATDEETDQVWRDSRIEVWAPRAAFTGNAAAVQAYAAELNVAACSFCHDLRPADKLTANDWIGAMNNMKRMTQLTADEARLIQRHLQLGASDMKPAR